MKLQYFVISFEELTHWKRLMLGGIGGTRKRVQQRMRWLDRGEAKDSALLSSRDAGLWSPLRVARGSASWLSSHGSSLEKTDAWRDWGHQEKGTTENEMAGWHHQLDGCEFE